MSSLPFICAGASGAAARVAASLAEDKRSWRVPLPWFESGQHRVSLFMDGAQVCHTETPFHPYLGKTELPVVKAISAPSSATWMLHCSLAGRSAMM